jgi:hypothetical protein
MFVVASLYPPQLYPFCMPTASKQREAALSYVRFEILKAMNVKNAVFPDLTPCGSS